MKCLYSPPNIMALKKHRLLSGILGLTMILLLMSRFIPSINLDISLEVKDRYVAAHEPFDLVFKHNNGAHPYLDIKAMSDIRISNEEKTLSLEVIKSQSVMTHDGFTLTTLTFASPFSEMTTSFMIEDAYLEIRASDTVLSFEAGTFGFFSQVPIHSDHVQTLYGFRMQNQPSLSGLYLGIKIPVDYELESIQVVDQIIDLNSVIMTDERYNPTLDIYNYPSISTRNLEEQIVNYIIPLTHTTIVETAPILMTFKARWDVLTVYIPPFTFIRSIPFLDTIPTAQGVYDD